ncbi:MAG: hypothetical protein M3R25_13665 [Bacteroidota bacterium]|nr:hypothetical protein [Bacteroidota bacterium]
MVDLKGQKPAFPKRDWNKNRTIISGIKLGDDIPGELVTLSWRQVFNKVIIHSWL